MKTILIGLIVCGIVFQSTNARDVACYDIECPENTTGCKKTVKTHKDQMSKTIYCLDENNGELRKHFSEEANPYGSFTHYESTSYSNTRTYTSSTGNNVLNPGVNINNYYNNKNDGATNGIEDFS